MGSSIACAGDVNGDGFSDFLLGAEYYDNGQFNEGAVFVFHGQKGYITNHASMLESNQANAWFGTAVASAGDVNGDGYSDILVGCYTYDNGQTDEGHVFVYHGGAEGIGTNEALTLSGGVSGAMIGYSVASAGDVNSDGFDDVIVGAPEYDYNGITGGIAIVYNGSADGIDANNKVILSKTKPGSYFGSSVAAAGDVNGDGYGDIIIGARDYSDGQNKEGAAFIFPGSNSGIVAGLSQTLQKDVANAGLGTSVSGAGDINRDGFADVVIGAPNFASGQNTFGAIYIYYGSSNNGAQNPTMIQGYSVNSGFGSDVSSAGDINGDGFSDVIAGAYAESLGEVQEGAAYIFQGANGGINSAGKVLQSNQPNAWFGASVASAGDVNADGFGDIVVGAPYYDKNEFNEGVAFVYYGNSSGVISANPAPAILEINMLGAQFGSSVQSAGDVNGDGYSDIVIGAKYASNGQTEEGKIAVFHGSPIGIKPTASFSIESDQNNANLGFAVSGAGDVNGDGYSDIIIGTPHANAGAGNNVGSAMVFYGNNGKGLQNNVRLFNTNFTPINYAQFSEPNFISGLFTKSFVGKNKGKLVWETMGAEFRFRKSETIRSPQVIFSQEYLPISPIWLLEVVF
ncbi:FG-GAP repeat-containing protein [Dyadobacter soli]|uniref:FG-GAP repeat-containing protein n=1 Tax=Dyadobacter soli TaxID=659014 RepID=A0A1G8C1A8_9BACT|nr:integrin alpha [Dyadobacter soli]SDH39154.1 FG-GAP repeat-containing protein [Dyadobacter soli]